MSLFPRRRGGHLEKVLRWPSRRAKEWVDSFISQCASNEAVLAVVAVGSAVRRNVQSVDLDLVVIVRDPEALGRQRPPLDVDVRTYVAEKVESMIRHGHDYLGWAVRFGQVVHEKERFWNRLTSTLRSELPLPSAAVARKRAFQAHKHMQHLVESGDEEAAKEQLISFLTHRARAQLIEAGIYPASRPELPSQLEQIGDRGFATLLTRAIEGRVSPREVLVERLPEPAS